MSGWRPLVIVPRPSGDVRLGRLSGDFKLTVNKAATLEQYPLSRAKELFYFLLGCQVFSKLDMSHAHNQIELDDQSHKYVVVNTLKGVQGVYKIYVWYTIIFNYFSEDIIYWLDFLTWRCF